MALQTPIPIFRIFSAELAKSFHVDFLGFKIEWEHCFGDASPGSSVFMPVTDIQLLYQALQAKDYQYAKPSIQQVDWGLGLQRTQSV